MFEAETLSLNTTTSNLLPVVLSLLILTGVLHSYTLTTYG